jgi:hypothetical protein
VDSRLYAYDPGGTTGWARFEVLGKIAFLTASGEFPLWRDIPAQLAIDYQHYDVVVVYENIIPRYIDFNPVGLQTIGVIRYLCESLGIPHAHQPNSVIHGVEKWGLYSLDHVRSPHARDAISHGIVYLRKLGITVNV